MTDKLITHEEAFKALIETLPRQIGSPSSSRKLKASGIVQKYIKQQEQFSKDVARYFELNYRHDWYRDLTKEEYQEYYKLELELTKGGIR